MTDKMKCPKCGGEMEKGMIPEINQLGGVSNSQWITKTSFMKGMENKHSIITYRCTSPLCGFLESYAK